MNRTCEINDFIGALRKCGHLTFGDQTSVKSVGDAFVGVATCFGAVLVAARDCGLVGTRIDVDMSSTDAYSCLMEVCGLPVCRRDGQEFERGDILVIYFKHGPHAVVVLEDGEFPLIFQMSRLAGRAVEINLPRSWRNLKTEVFTLESK